MPGPRPGTNEGDVIELDRIPLNCSGLMKVAVALVSIERIRSRANRVHLSTAGDRRSAMTARDVEDGQDRWVVITRGMRGRCPRCGQGALFRSSLALSEACS